MGDIRYYSRSLREMGFKNIELLYREFTSAYAGKVKWYTRPIDGWAGLMNKSLIDR